MDSTSTNGKPKPSRWKLCETLQRKKILLYTIGWTKHTCQTRRSIIHERHGYNECVYFWFCWLLKFYHHIMYVIALYILQCIKINTIKNKSSACFNSQQSPPSQSPSNNSQISVWARKRVHPLSMYVWKSILESTSAGDWTPVLLAPTMLQCESRNSVFQRCHSMSHCEQANYDAKLLAEKNRVLFEFN